ncbi:hypothetical protein DFH06DRAFT_1214921 [Mycena polygramma]|nr:hypothetical protein DFH06DRAFT_1214921 [Mycena polygramma]
MSSAMYALNANANTISPPLLAASIGAAIPWHVRLAELGCNEILLSYGPSHFKVCLGDAEATEVWNEGRNGSTIPISRVHTPTEAVTLRPTKARLRAVLVSACVRAFRRQQSMVAPIRIPTIIPSPTDESDSESDSSDYPESDYSSTSSYSDESRTSAGSSPISPTDSIKCTPTAFKLVSSRLPLYRPKPSSSCAAAPVNHWRVDTTAYSYQGGMTRVLSGGVKLGEHHLFPATRP